MLLMFSRWNRNKYRCCAPISTYVLNYIELQMCRVSLTSIHDHVAPDFRLPVVPGDLKALGKADAEILEVAFAHQRSGGAGGDERALDGQDQSWAGVKIDGGVGLAESSREGRRVTRASKYTKEHVKWTRVHVLGNADSGIVGNTSFCLCWMWTTSMVEYTGLLFFIIKITLADYFTLWLTYHVIFWQSRVKN